MSSIKKKANPTSVPSGKKSSAIEKSKIRIRASSPPPSEKKPTSTKKEVVTKKENAKKELKPVIVAGLYEQAELVKPKKGLVAKKFSEENRKIREKRSAKDYRKLTQHEHVYYRPATYIGSMEPEERTDESFDFESKRLVPVKIEVPYAMIHLFVEVIANAGDNAKATRGFATEELPPKLASKLKDVGKLEVWIDKKRIRVRNGGMPIPIIPSETLDGELVPLSIFGELNSGSNYDDDEIKRSGSGANGLGSKACNIFSTYFRVRAGDPINGQEFDCIWTSNMTEIAYFSCSPGYQRSKDGTAYLQDANGNYLPNPGPKYTGPAYVDVEYQLDFERFGYKKYPDEILGIFAQRALFMGMSCKMLVTLNDEEYDVRSIRNFARLRFSDEVCKSAIYHVEWPQEKVGRKWVTQIPEKFKDLKPAAIEKIIANPKSAEDVPMTELLALDTPNEGCTLSIVNSQATPEGGVHVTESLRAIGGSILKEINETISGIKNKTKKNDKKDEKKETKMPKLTIEAVKPHLSMVVSCHLTDTTYSTQTKVKLTKTHMDLTIDPKLLAKVKKWKMVVHLYEAMNSKIGKALKQSDGKKKKNISPDKGEDANLAGGPRSQECYLLWAEGDSATSYDKSFINKSKGGKDLGGYMPGKGKFLNVCKATPEQLISNTEIARFKEFTGVFEGMDVSKPRDKARMRYGKIIITTDADKDGQHILMLRLNYIWRNFPSLIREGMVGYLVTPFARALKGVGRNEKCLQVFRDEAELHAWLEANKDWFIPDSGGHWIKYYKGLASSGDREIIQDVKEAPIVVIVEDDTAEESLDIAFMKGNEDKRKLWIFKWRKELEVSGVVFEPLSKRLFELERSITSLCNRNLVDYSKETYIRALPSEDDGLKESQRKSLYAGLVHWAFGKGRARAEKTGRMANEAAGLTHYHYNEACLTDTYTRQSQEFTGALNMSYFTPEGQLGTRHEGGADAGESRYTFILIAPWIKYVYYADFLKVVPRKKSEGSLVEPEWLPAVIPMHLVNGFKGVATAYATFSPCHNPFHCIDWIRARCSGKEPEPILPWYTGFKGKLAVRNVNWKAPPPDEEKFLTSQERKETGQPEIEEAEEGGEEKEGEEEVEEEKEGEKLEQELSLRNRAVKGKPSLKTYGVFSQKGEEVRITDLPIGVWTYNYRKMWEKLREEGEISDIIDHSEENTVNLTIKGYKGEADHKSLRLTKSFGLTNLVLIDRYGYPTRFANTQQVLERYYTNMIRMFAELRKLQLREIKEMILDVDQRLLFIISHNTGKLVIKEREDEDVYAQMTELGIEHKYYDIVKIRDCSAKKIKELHEQREKHELEYARIKATTPEEIWLGYLDKLEAALRKLKLCLPGESQILVEPHKKKKIVIAELEDKKSPKKLPESPPKKKLPSPQKKAAPLEKKAVTPKRRIKVA